MRLLLQPGVDGLAAAIGAASLCMIVVPALLGGGLGWLALRRRSSRGGALVGAVVGGGLGFLAMAATFFEGSLRPPRTIVFDVPPGFAHDAVILLEDPTAPPIPWTGTDLPFFSPSARLTVPRGGVVRVRALSDDCDGALSTGETAWAILPATAPTGVTATGIVVYLFGDREPELPLDGSGSDGLAAVIRAREGER